MRSFRYVSCYREPELDVSVCSAIMTDAFLSMASLRTSILRVPDGFPKMYLDAMHSAPTDSFGTLQNLQIAGDIDLVDFLVGRTVRSLVIQTSLNSKDLDTLAHGCRGSGAYHSLRYLHLPIQSFDIFEIFDHLKQLDYFFPTLYFALVNRECGHFSRGGDVDFQRIH